MNPVPDPATKFYLVINGAPQGPYNAGMVMNLWQQKSVDAATLICAEGGAAWVPLQEMEPVLRAVAPPVAPVGYGGAPTTGTAPRTSQPAAVQQLEILKDGDNTRTLRLSTLAAALVLFFLPWLELKCAGQRVAYQSGVQTVLNRISPDVDMQEMARGRGGWSGNPEAPEGNELGEKVGTSYLTAGALLCLVMAFAVAIGASGRAASGVMAGLALALLGLQAVVGFPLQAAVEKEMKLVDRRTGPSDSDAGGEDMGLAIGRQIMTGMMPRVSFSPWFYAELVLLGAVAVIGLSGAGSQKTR